MEILIGIYLVGWVLTFIFVTLENGNIFQASVFAAVWPLFWIGGIVGFLKGGG